MGSFPVDINRRGADEPALSVRPTSIQEQRGFSSVTQALDVCGEQGSVPISIPSKKLGKMSSSTEDSFLPPHELAEGRGKVPVQEEEQEALEMGVVRSLCALAH